MCARIYTWKAYRIPCRCSHHGHLPVAELEDPGDDGTENMEAAGPEESSAVPVWAEGLKLTGELLVGISGS